MIYQWYRVRIWLIGACDCKGVQYRREMITSQKLNLWNQGTGRLIQREHGEICSLAKNEPVHLQIGGNVEVLFSLWASVSCCLPLARVLFKICYSPIFGGTLECFKDWRCGSNVSPCVCFQLQGETLNLFLPINHCEYGSSHHCT